MIDSAPMTSPKNDPFIALITEIFRIHGRFRLLFQGSAGSTGLTRIQNAVLATVIETQHPRTVAQLGRSLGHPRQVIQRTTNELIDRGLLGMQDNPADRRAKVVVPTPDGLALKSTADAWAKEISSQLLAGLEGGLCERITADLTTLRGAIDVYVREHGMREPAEPEFID